MELVPPPPPESAQEYVDAAAWLQAGVERGWCSKSVCATHDGLPNTPDEELEWEEGHDPCVPAVRLW